MQSHIQYQFKTAFMHYIHAYSRTYINNGSLTRASTSRSNRHVASVCMFILRRTPGSVFRKYHNLGRTPGWP